MVFLALILSISRRWTSVITATRDRRMVGRLAVSSLLIAINWGVFIWAVDHERVLESSLGYFISPLVSVGLGVAVLGERLRVRQWLAIALAAGGVGFEVMRQGVVPWVALSLGASFAAYGLVRKVAQIEPVSGLFLESALLAPAAFLYLGASEAAGSGFAGRPEALNVMLLLAGPVTALPLILFVAGARRIQLSTLGLLQYITPTGQFLLAVFAFGEPFPAALLVVFLCIWSGLALYTADGLIGKRRL
jgi:chloramphenicol-sensitive protein RarD